MKKKEPLFECIHKMEGAEKRYFSLFATRHSQENEGKKYLTLFTHIESDPQISFTRLKEAMKQAGFETRYLLADCNYLYHLILQSLNQFHNKKSYSIRVKNLTVSAEIYFYKGLFDHAVKQLHKAEKMAMEVENLPLLLEVLFWQKRCLGYSKGLQKASEVNEKINNTLHRINQLQAITNLYYKSYQLHIDKENSDLEETVSAFRDLFRQPVMREERSITSLTARIYFHLIHAHKYYAENYSKKELGALKKIEDIFRIFPQYQQEHPLDYISIMDRILNLKKF